MFGLSRFAIVTIGLMIASSSFGGNGIERGGGEFRAQDFAAAGQEAIEWIRRWRQQGIVEFSSLDPILIEQAIRETSVHVSATRLPLNGEGKDAINEPRIKKITVFEEAWATKSKDPVQRLSFALHEYLAIARIADHRYEVTALFSARLQAELNQRKFKTEFSSRLREYASAHIRKFQDRFERMLSNMYLIQGSTDFEDCVHPAYFASRADKLAPCLGVTAMLVLMQQQASTLNPSKHDQDKADFKLLSEMMSLAESLGIKNVEKVRRKTDSIIARYNHSQKSHPIEDPTILARKNIQDYILSIPHEQGRAAAWRSVNSFDSHMVKSLKEADRELDLFNAGYNAACPGGLKEAIECAIPRLIGFLTNDFAKSQNARAQQLEQALAAEIEKIENSPLW